MGYFLLYESMLDTVLIARDRWLAPGGLLFPDKASLYLTAIEDEEYRDDKVDFWDNVYGFKMSCIKKNALTEPLVDIAHGNQIMGNYAKILDIDLYTVTKEELDFSSPFTIKVERTDACHAILAHFDVEFSKCIKKTGFSTSARHTRTHWKQVVFYLEEPLACKKDEIIVGSISVKRNGTNPRDLDISMDSKLVSADPSRAKEQSMEYRLR
jgi:protein arginine N-methyltransferase 1